MVKVSALFLLLGAASAALQPAPKVMPLGDSITAWSDGGYRSRMGKMMKNSFFPASINASTMASPSPRFIGAGDPVTRYRTCGDPTNSSSPPCYVFDFVGSQSAEGDHEGHSGYTIVDTLAFAETVLRQHAPDIILLLLGTNDVFGHANATALAGRMNALLDVVFATLPDVRVLLGGTTQPVSYVSSDLCDDVR